jgi:hypothetical protein
VAEKNLEAALLLALVGFLVGPELFNEGVFIRIGGGGGGGILVDDGDAIVPAAVLSGVVGRGLDFDGENAAGRLDLFEQRVMVLQEEREEFLLMAPLALVVVLDGVGLAGRALCGGAPWVRSGMGSGARDIEKKSEESARRILRMGTPVDEMEAL